MDHVSLIKYPLKRNDYVYQIVTHRLSQKCTFLNSCSIHVMKVYKEGLSRVEGESIGNGGMYDKFPYYPHRVTLC